MTYDSALFDSAQIYLEIDPTLQAQSWQHSQGFATASSCWNAYINELCLGTVLDWLREEYDAHATPSPSTIALANLWEFVNGSAVMVQGMRLILLPVETIDTDELRVPQEWVDLANWVGDYYLAVQVNLDEAWIRINGFIRHQQLKAKAQYDWSDRTYSLDEVNLISNLNALWVARQLCPEEVTRAEVEPLPFLTAAQADSLMQRLSNPAIILPRLAVPFQQWGALVAHDGWRQQLMEHRRGLPEQRSLRQWLQSGISAFAQQVGWQQIEFQPSLASARGDIALAPLALASPLTINQQPYELLISLINSDANIWRFELRSQKLGGLIPAEFTLRLLTEDLQTFDGNEDTAIANVDRLYVEVALEPGEGLVWEVDPQPDAYIKEILRF
ncbi:MAG: DUF1822 family protein [Elainellaceae cyanobacterium]